MPALPRVLLVLPDPPLPFGKAVARHFYTLLRSLRTAGYPLTAFIVCGGQAERDATLRWFPAAEYDLRFFAHPRLGGWPARWRSFRRPRSYIFSPELRRALECEGRRGFDVLHLEDLWSGWLGERHWRRALLEVHYLPELDFASPANGAAARRGRESLHNWRLFRAQRRLLRSYPHLATASPRIAAYLRRQLPRADVASIPLSITPELYRFEDRFEAVLRAPDAPRIGLIGSFDWHPTYHAAVRLLTRLWPELRRHNNAARLLLVGRAAVRQLGKWVHGDERIEVHEDVAEIASYFHQLDVLVYPLTAGSGVKVKVQEAFAWGVPVVTTAAGAEGLCIEDGVHAGLAEDDAGLVARTLELLHDPERRQRQRLAARQLLERDCGPAALLQSLAPVYAGIAGRGLSSIPLSAATRRQ